MKRRSRIVFAGFLVRNPLGGYFWQTAHYLVGLQSLGHEVWFYEDTSGYQSAYNPMADETGSSYGYGLEAVAGFFRRIGLAHSWVFVDTQSGTEHGPCAGRSESLLREADLLVDFGPVSYRVIDRRQGKPAILIDSDPVHTQLRLVAGEPDFKPRLDAHKCLFTFGENIGTPRSPTPTAGYLWHPTRQPVAVEGWRNADPPGSTYTTVGLWFTPEWDLTVQGRKVQGSKRPDWLRCLDLPARTGAAFEIAARGFGGVPEDRGLLEAHGWRLRDALAVSSDPWRYRDYLIRSRGEFSLAKNTVVAMRSGWFSDRSACYLAAGRPVVLQDTGFGDVLPLGPGLHAFRNVEEAAGAIEEIEADYARASAHASEVAREYFAAEKVLGRLLSEAGL